MLFKLLDRLPGAGIIECPPLMKGSRVPGWAQKATRDPAQIARLLESNVADEFRPNIGLVIGPRVAVIDVEGPDKANEKSREGLRNLAGLESKYGLLPQTVTVTTPSGGQHRYYMVPDGISLKPYAKLFGAEGVELRTGDNLVMVPPSRVRKASGEIIEYSFASGCSPEEIEVAELPASWIAALQTGEEKKEQKPVILRTQSPSSPEKKPQLAPIFVGCAFMQHVVEDAATLSEPDWHTALSIIPLCEDGIRLAHDISASYPGYTYAETQAKIEHAVKDAKPRTCTNIARNFEGCQRCPFHAMHGTSPIALGYQPEYLVKAQANTVYVAETQQYIELDSLQKYLPSAFAAKVRHRVGRNPHDQLMASKTMPKVDRIDYLAGNDGLIIQADHSKVLNLWRRSGVIPSEGDATKLLTFIEYLIPDEVSRAHLYDFLAHLIQQRGSKIKHAVILTGTFGVGKSSFNALVQRLFGENARQIEGEQLGSKWTEQLVNCEVLIAEEAALGGKWETYERLKELITGERFTVEQKFISPYSARTPRALIITSNHDNPLVIVEGDRRFCVMEAAREKASTDFFNALYLTLADDTAIAAFAYWLLRRDISAFNPNVAPPMTAAKKRAVEASRTPLAQLISETIESGRLWRDVVTLEQVASALAVGPFASGPVTPHRLAKALKQLGAVELARLRNGATCVRPWAIRQVDRWQVAAPAQIRDELNRPLPAEVLAEFANVIPIPNAKLG